MRCISVQPAATQWTTLWEWRILDGLKTQAMSIAMFTNYKEAYFDALEFSIENGGPLLTAPVPDDDNGFGKGATV